MEQEYIDLLKLLAVLPTLPIIIWSSFYIEIFYYYITKNKLKS